MRRHKHQAKQKTWGDVYEWVKMENLDCTIPLGLTSGNSLL